MKTRQQELDELQTRISELADKASEVRSERDRQKYEAQAEGLRTTGLRLINERHDQLDAKRAEQQAAFAQLEADREAQIRAELRRGFKGTELDFERLYPAMRDRYLVDQAIARAGEIEPAMKPSFVI